MGASPLEAVLRKDRLVILTSILALTALAWCYVLWLSGHMVMPPAAGPDMSGMDMAAMAPLLKPWTGADILFTLVMWSVMMVGMMAPSAAPMILIYALVGRQAQAQQKPFAATGWFAGGYFLAWAGFSVAATLAQAILSQAALLTPMLKSANDLLAAGLLIAAGLYQWSPWKDSCLTHCRSPLSFIQQHGGFRAQEAGSLMLGFRHGLYCVGCCSGLMLLLFAAGIMNIAWIAALAILILVEKLAKSGSTISKATGVAFIAGGLFLIYADLAR